MAECLLRQMETEEGGVMIACPLTKSGFCGYRNPEELPKQFLEIDKNTTLYFLRWEFIKKKIFTNYRRRCRGAQSPNK